MHCLFMIHHCFDSVDGIQLVESNAVTFTKGLLLQNNIAWSNIYCVRQHAIAHICYRNSGRLSVTRVDQSKTVEARIMQLSPQGSP